MPVPQAASSTALVRLIRCSKRAAAGWLIAPPSASTSSSNSQS